MSSLRQIDKVMTFGKYDGVAWKDIPLSYITWLYLKMKRDIARKGNCWGSSKLLARIQRELAERPTVQSSDIYDARYDARK